MEVKKDKIKMTYKEAKTIYEKNNTLIQWRTTYYIGDNFPKFYLCLNKYKQICLGYSFTEIKLNLIDFLRFISFYKKDQSRQKKEKYIVETKKNIDFLKILLHKG